MSTATKTPMAGRTEAGLSFFTSEVRLAGAVRKMANAETVPAVVAIKDAAKPLLLPRDLPKLKTAFDKRLNELRLVQERTKAFTNLPTAE